MTLVVASPRVYTVHGVPLSVTGIAQVKITSNNEEMLRAAVEQFIDKTDKEIQDIARATLEGHQRAIMGALTVDEIFKEEPPASPSCGPVWPKPHSGAGVSLGSRRSHSWSMSRSLSILLLHLLQKAFQ